MNLHLPSLALHLIFHSLYQVICFQLACLQHRYSIPFFIFRRFLVLIIICFECISISLLHPNIKSNIISVCLFVCQSACLYRRTYMVQRIANFGESATTLSLEITKDTKKIFLKNLSSRQCKLLVLPSNKNDETFSF